MLPLVLLFALQGWPGPSDRGHTGRQNQEGALFARTPANRRQKRSVSSRRNDNIEDMSVERGLFDRGFFPTIGSDESGRGTIAGPVVVASCCILSPPGEYVPIIGVQDSKMLTTEFRKNVYDTIVSQPDVYAFRIVTRSHEEIDEMNIQKSSMAAFAESIDLLVTEELSGRGTIREHSGTIGNDDDTPTKETRDGDINLDSRQFSPYSIVDGKQSPKLELTKTPCRPWVKGDAQVYTVALASILAKVTHDTYMREEAHVLYPEYGFDENKGHALPDHVAALHKYGPCPIHRKSVRTMRGR